MFDENGKYIGEDATIEENAVENTTEEPEAVEEAVNETAEGESKKEDDVYDVEKAFTNDFEQPEKKVKKRCGLGKRVVAVGLCAAVAGVVFSTAASLTEKSIDTFRSLGTTQENLVTADPTEALPLSYSEFGEGGYFTIENIAKACLPSVVSITNKGVSEIMTFFGNYQTESISSGSGIIIGENDKELLIVTNYHVVADSKELTVVFSHEENAAKQDDSSKYINIAKVKGYDADKDIAVIAVNLDEISSESRSGISIATIGNSNDIKLGSGVVAIGNALGSGQSVTHGIISAVDREVTMNGVKGGQITNKYIQTDAAINSGNSGGALLNMKGELIGINSAKISSTGVEGMGYAIPITDVEKLISELMSVKTRDVVPEDKRGYLGIYGTDVTSQANQLYGMPVGIFVQERIEGSPAAKSDLQDGDIIVKIDNVNVTSMASLQDRLSYYEAGETIKLTVKRIEGRQYVEAVVEVKLGTKSDAGVEE